MAPKTIARPICFFPDGIDLFRRCGHLAFVARGLLFAFKSLLPKISRAAFGLLICILLYECQVDGPFGLRCGVETLRDAKVAFRARTALCLLDGRSLDRFDFRLLNQPADVEFGLTGFLAGIRDRLSRCTLPASGER